MQMSLASHFFLLLQRFREQLLAVSQSSLSVHSALVAVAASHSDLEYSLSREA